MTNIFTYSFKKSKRLKKISNIIGFVAKLNPSDLVEYWSTVDEEMREKQENATEELFNSCESDPYTIKVMEKYNADRETLRKAYEKLIYAGAGQWKRGHYVPASSLVYNQTLDYLLKNIDKPEKEFSYVAWRLLKYFENREKGTIEE